MQLDRANLIFDLKCINVFRQGDLTKDQFLELIDAMEVQSFKKGAEITVLNQKSKAALYLVLSGGVWLERAGMAPVKLPQGCNFGEEMLAAAEGKPNAMVTAPYTVKSDSCTCAILTMDACRGVFDIDQVEKALDVKIAMSVARKKMETPSPDKKAVKKKKTDDDDDSVVSSKVKKKKKKKKKVAVGGEKDIKIPKKLPKLLEEKVAVPIETTPSGQATTPDEAADAETINQNKNTEDTKDHVESDSTKVPTCIETDRKGTDELSLKEVFGQKVGNEEKESESSLHLSKELSTTGFEGSSSSLASIRERFQSSASSAVSMVRLGKSSSSLDMPPRKDRLESSGRRGVERSSSALCMSRSDLLFEDKDIRQSLGKTSSARFCLEEKQPSVSSARNMFENLSSPKASIKQKLGSVATAQGTSRGKQKETTVELDSDPTNAPAKSDEPANVVKRNSAFSAHNIFERKHPPNVQPDINTVTSTLLHSGAEESEQAASTSGIGPIDAQGGNELQGQHKTEKRDSFFSACSLFESKAQNSKLQPVVPSTQKSAVSSYVPSTSSPRRRPAPFSIKKSTNTATAESLTKDTTKASMSNPAVPEEPAKPETNSAVKSFSGPPFSSSTHSPSLQVVQKAESAAPSTQKAIVNSYLVSTSSPRRTPALLTVKNLQETSKAIRTAEDTTKALTSCSIIPEETVQQASSEANPLFAQTLLSSRSSAASQAEDEAQQAVPSTQKLIASGCLASASSPRKRPVHFHVETLQETGKINIAAEDTTQASNSNAVLPDEQAQLIQTSSAPKPLPGPRFTSSTHSSSLPIKDKAGSVGSSTQKPIVSSYLASTSSPRTRPAHFNAKRIRGTAKVDNAAEDTKVPNPNTLVPGKSGEPVRASSEAKPHLALPLSSGTSQHLKVENKALTQPPSAISNKDPSTGDEELEGSQPPAMKDETSITSVGPESPANGTSRPVSSGQVAVLEQADGTGGGVLSHSCENASEESKSVSPVLDAVPKEECPTSSPDVQAGVQLLSTAAVTEELEMDKDTSVIEVGNSSTAEQQSEKIPWTRKGAEVNVEESDASVGSTDSISEAEISQVGQASVQADSTEEADSSDTEKDSMEIFNDRGQRRPKSQSSVLKALEKTPSKLKKPKPTPSDSDSEKDERSKPVSPRQKKSNAVPSEGGNELRRSRNEEAKSPQNFRLKNSNDPDQPAKKAKGKEISSFLSARKKFEARVARNGSNTGPRPPKNVFQNRITLPKDYNPPVHPKTEKEEKQISSALKKRFVFKNLPEHTIGTLISAFESRHVPKGKIIVEQGKVDDYFYVVSEGECQFEVDGVKTEIARKGDSFGEDALVFLSPRDASVRANKDTDLFQVDQKTFRCILQTEMAQNEKNKREILKKVECLQGSTPESVHKLTSIMVPVDFKKGDTLTKSSHFGDKFHFITEGKVECRDVKFGRKSKPNKVLGPGSYFGKHALVEDPFMKADVVALTSGKAYTIDRERKDKVLGTTCRVPIEARIISCVRALERIEFKPLSYDEIMKMSSLIRDVSYKEGDTIIEPSTEHEAAVYFLREGKVHTQKGRQLVLLTPGNFFGDSIFQDAKDKKITTGKMPEKVIADTDVICGVIQIRDYYEAFGDKFKDTSSKSKAEIALDDTAKSQKGLKKAKGTGKAAGKESKKASRRHIPLDNLDKRVCLGEGEFGQIWLCADKMEKKPRPYVLKIMSKAHLVSEGQAEVCLREKTVLAEVSHPFIVELVGTYNEKAFVFMLMEFVQGGELFSVMNSAEGRLKLKESQAKFYALGIADALAYLHQKKYVYRDLKPENVVIDSMGYPKLIDFGFAKKVLDHTFTLCGTPGYLAPELVSSRGHNWAVDHWALGVLIYEMVSGSSPFYVDGIEQFELFRSIAEDDFPYIEDLSHSAYTLICGLLEKDPSNRLGSFANGEKDILHHAWFEEVDVMKLRHYEIEAPWKPTVNDPFDTSNFDDWSGVDDKMLDAGERISKKHEALFDGF